MIYSQMPWPFRFTHNQIDSAAIPSHSSSPAQQHRHNCSDLRRRFVLGVFKIPSHIVNDGKFSVFLCHTHTPETETIGGVIHYTCKLCEWIHLFVALLTRERLSCSRTSVLLHRMHGNDVLVWMISREREKERHNAGNLCLFSLCLFS